MVAANFGYSPNSEQPNVFMAVAMDLPEFESPIGPLVYPLVGGGGDGGCGGGGGGGGGSGGGGSQLRLQP